MSLQIHLRLWFVPASNLSWIHSTSNLNWSSLYVLSTVAQKLTFLVSFVFPGSRIFTLVIITLQMCMRLFMVSQVYTNNDAIRLEAAKIKFRTNENRCCIFLLPNRVFLKKKKLYLFILWNSISYIIFVRNNQLKQNEETMTKSCRFYVFKVQNLNI